MNWEDTVIPEAKVSLPLPVEGGHHLEYCQGYKDGHNDGRKSQAEITWDKAIKEVMEWIATFGGLCNKIEGEDPEYGHQVQYWACRDDLSDKEYEELGTYYRFVIEVGRKEWQAKLKDWNIQEE